MSFVIVAPEALMSVASEVAGIGSVLNAANAAAAAPTTGVLAAAADEVSAAMAALFGAHAQEYQRLSAQAAGFHAQFVQALNAGVNSYASAEAANASPLQAVEQQVLGLINGRPNNAWAGAFTTPNKSCNGAALVASATTYERAPFVRDCTNWA